MKLKRIMAGIAALAMAFSLTACGGKKEKDSASEKEASSDSVTEASSETEKQSGISGQEITWLSYYDVNPVDSEERSAALSLFEDVYGGKVSFVYTSYEKKYDVLSEKILGGEPVDMFPYEPNAFPYGAAKELFQPLDDYIDLDDELWAGIRDVADSMTYKDAHYVIPYSISEPACLIYSRKLVKDEGLDDPYKLYESGKWDWDAFVSMMDDFSGEHGCAGLIGPAAIHSTGMPVVGSDGASLSNNTGSEEIEKAEQLLEKLSNNGYYTDGLYTRYPSDGSLLFLSAGPWALSESNGENSDGDMFLVPFPKAPGADKYYIDCTFDAKMLAAKSDKGEAVAAYIKCERIAATDEKYAAGRKENALKAHVNDKGEKLKYITEEQYNVISEMTDTSKFTPVFDYGTGMGRKMSTETYEYESRGAYKNITDGLVSGYEGSPTSWEELREKWSGVIDEEIKKY